MPNPAADRPATPALPYTKGWVIGRVTGAPLILQPVWFLVVAVLTGILVPIVRSALPDVAPEWTVLVAAVFVVVLFASVLAHEVAHAVVATRLGQRVHEVVLSALGGHTAFTRGSLGPGGSALVAAAGPLVNLLIGGVLLAGAQPLLDGQSTTQRAVGVLVAAMASANLLVGGFNLVPGLPLDGGQLLAALVWRVTGRRHTGTVVAAWTGRALALALLGWAFVLPVLAGRRPELVTVVWTVLVAGAIWSGAGGALRQAVLQERSEGLSVEGVGRAATTLPAGASVADVVALGPGEVVLLADDGAPAALVDRAAVAAVPPALAASTPAGSVAVALHPDAVVDADLRGTDLLGALVVAFRSARVAVAVRQGVPVAVLLEAEVARHLRSTRPA